MSATQPSTARLATELEILSAIADLRSALKEGPRCPNIWGFFSNKNRQLLTLVGDVTFIQAVLLEGDARVSSYSIGQPPSTEAEHYRFGRDLLVQYQDGSRHWYLCGRYENLIKAPGRSIKERIEQTRSVAQQAGTEFYIRTERDFINRMTEFRNWLTMCSAMTRSRDFSSEYESAELFSMLAEHNAISIGQLLETPKSSPALMLAAVARALCNGYAQLNPREAPLSAETQVSCVVTRNPKVVSHPETLVPSTQHVRPAPIPINRRTMRIPDVWRDLQKWPSPTADHLSFSNKYQDNKRAVEMYIANRDFEAIHRETGIKEDWVRQLFKKCLRIHKDGRIMGFRALITYGRDSRAEYRRRLPPPSTNLETRATSGYAGALVQLFERFPDELLQIVEAKVLKLRAGLGPELHESRISWKDLQTDVLAFLKKKGVRNSEYPFNTVDRIYCSLATLGRSILFKRPIRFIRSRFGKAAADLANTGKGISSLIQATGPFQIVELDFHKHDSAAIVDIKTPSGFMIPCPVPRFWIGCLVDVYNRAILGSSDSFEAQTTESCVLDLIESAIAPPSPSTSLSAFRNCEDGCWLPNQLLPTFGFHGWDILRLDRALAHQGTSTLTGLIATTGCAVCFSKPRAWWARSIVERTFNELTRRGAQRLPTTYGTGPEDDRRRHPEQTAVNLHFTQDEMCDIARSIIRELNDTGREGVFWESPLNNIRRAATMPSYVARPLPEARRDNRPTQWVRCRRKVEANVARGIVPSVRIPGCRYHGGELANAWALAGQFVFLEIDRHDIRNARVVSEQTATVIGKIESERKWRLHRICWRNFLMIQKFGPSQADTSRPEDPVLDFKQRKAIQIQEASSRGKIRDKKKAAQQVRNLERDLGCEDKTASRSELVADGNSVEPLHTAPVEASASQQRRVSLTPAPIIGSFSRG